MSLYWISSNNATDLRLVSGSITVALMRISGYFHRLAGSIGCHIFAQSPRLYVLLKRLTVWIYDKSGSQSGMALVSTDESLPSKKEFEIVVAKYNEDTRWVKSVRDNATLYVKGKSNEGIRLPNKGYEAGTYLYHIVENYDQLADRTLFFQGHPFDHDVFPLTTYLKSDQGFTGKFTPHQLVGFDAHWAAPDQPIDERRMRGFLRLMECDDTINTIHWAWGAQFSVDRSIIRERSREYWQRAYNISQQDVLELEDVRFDNHHIAFLYELFWWDIFTSHYRSPKVNA